MLVAGCGGSGTSGAVSGADAGQRVAPDSAGSIDTGGAEDAGAEVAEKDVAEDAPNLNDAVVDTILEDAPEPLFDAEVTLDAAPGGEEVTPDTALEDGEAKDIAPEDTYVPPVYDCGDEELYILQPIGYWRVCLSKELQGAPDDLADQVLTHLTGDLGMIESLLEASVVQKLQEVRIWLELDKALAPGGVYHPSAGWLANNGYPEYWAKGLQLGNAQNYLDWTSIQPAMVLHELSHAWHHQVLGYGQAEIKAAFEAAMASGIYENVAYAGGGTQEAYATYDHKEYFAELTEAYFWVNDFYPFNQEELEVHDPQGFEAVENAWSPVDP